MLDILLSQSSKTDLQVILAELILQNEIDLDELEQQEQQKKKSDIIYKLYIHTTMHSPLCQTSCHS